MNLYKTTYIMRAIEYNEDGHVSFAKIAAIWYFFNQFHQACDIILKFDL